jgi:hypothetical protein
MAQVGNGDAPPSLGAAKAPAPATGLGPDATPVPQPPPTPGRDAEQAASGAAKLDPGDDDAGLANVIYYSDVKWMEQEPPHLDFIRSKGAVTPPTGMRALRRQIEDVARLVRILFQDDAERRTKLFSLLHATAYSGLCGPNASIEIGLDNLQDVKNTIEDFYPAVRGKLWTWNLVLLAAISLVCAIAAAVERYMSEGWPWALTTVSLGQAWLMAAFLIPLGTMLGLFAEFIFRVNDDIPYEQLRTINPGRWKPFQRALNTTIIAFIFAGILGGDLIKVGISSVLLNDFVKDKPWYSLTIGFVTGFAFPYVRDLVQQVRPQRRDNPTGP